MANEPSTSETSQSSPPADVAAPPQTDGVGSAPPVESPPAENQAPATAPVLQEPEVRPATQPQVSQPKPATGQAGPPPESKDVFREVAETIVFVVVLVLLLKTFVAEAFVIPTGSMATTLWGYQKYVECPQCGYHFPVNCSSEMDPQNERGKQDVIGCICPNCRFPISFAEDGMQPSGNSGDRVLVFKALYDLKPLFGLDSAGPHCHDVVVFKFPDGPQKNHVAMNYIKRLIGLPGETIGIYYGKVYVTTQLSYPELPSPFEPGISEEERSRRKGALRALQEGDTKGVEALRRDAHAPMDNPQRIFRIVRKAPGTILAMMRPVYDNDFQPVNKLTFPIRWAETTDWKADNPALPRAFRLQPGREVAWLRYQHLIANSKPELITDFMGYNTARTQFSGFNDGKLSWATDLILEFELQVEKVDAGGELRIEIAKGVDRFQARFDLASGDCTLVRLSGAGAEPVEKVLTVPGSTEPARRPTAVKGPGTYKVRLANVDEKLTLWVNDELPFEAGVEYDPATKPGPTINDLKPASIGARSAAVTVAHVKLWRDTYYTVHAERGDGVRLDNETLANPNNWGPLRSLDANTIYCQPRHYLCLGDNSQESADSRSWGLVPQDLLLGRALVVYFPFYSPLPYINSPTNRVGMIR